jgi:uncharacterized membrane protein
MDNEEIKMNESSGVRMNGSSVEFDTSRPSKPNFGGNNQQAQQNYQQEQQKNYQQEQQNNYQQAQQNNYQQNYQQQNNYQQAQQNYQQAQQNNYQQQNYQQQNSYQQNYQQAPNQGYQQQGYQQQGYQQGYQQSYQADNSGKTSARTIAIISYLTWIGFIIGLIIRKDADDPQFVTFHINQALVLNLFAMLGVIPIVGWIWSIVLVIFWFICFIGACQGQEKKAPLIGGIEIIK